MAKGKHAVALFEVIQSSKRSHRGISDVLRTPKWWFKGRPSKDAAPASFGAPGGVIEPEVLSSAPAPRAAGIDLKLDPERQRITFRLSYTSAIVCGFAVVVIVALAYIIGVHVTRGPAPALAGPSTEQIRKGPAKPQVLDVKAPPIAKPAAPTVESEDAITAIPPPAPSSHTSTPAAAETDGQRVIGRNYVVVQIYPDEKSATEARDVLAKSGIQCSIEKGLPPYATNNWYCVVGLRGFDRIGSNPEYDRYEQAIRKAGEAFAGNSKFKKFDPHAYRWRG